MTTAGRNRVKASPLCSFEKTLKAMAIYVVNMYNMPALTFGLQVRSGLEIHQN